MKIFCGRGGGVQIALWESSKVDEMPARRIGDYVQLNYGENEVNDEFAKKWFEQNQNDELVEGQVIYEIHTVAD